MIMAYQNSDGMVAGYVVMPDVDYEKIKTLVLKIIEERFNVDTVFSPKESIKISWKQMKSKQMLDRL